MSLQAYITVIVATIGMLAHGFLTMKSKKAIKAEELLSVAMWCGAVVTGPYMFIGAFRLGRQAGEETNALYLAIFGVYLFLLSIQKVHEMLKRLLPKPDAAAPLPTENKNPG